MTCGICANGPYAGLEALRTHARRKHPEASRAEWNPGFVDHRKKGDSSERVAPAPPPQTDGITIYDQDVESRRVWPAASDRHNAEKLVDLPWLRYPTDRATCDSIAEVCTVVLNDRRIPDGTKAFFLSLRAHIVAVGERLKTAA